SARGIAAPARRAEGEPLPVEACAIRRVTERRTAVVSKVNDRAEFGPLEREWDELLDTSAQAGTVFLRHAFLRIWIDNFAPRSKLRVLLLRDEAGALKAALPLIEQRLSIYGVKVRALVSAANEHSCRFDLISKDQSAPNAFASYLEADDGWDV